MSPNAEKKVGSPLYSFSKIMERISPEKSPDGGPFTRRGVCVIYAVFFYISKKFYSINRYNSSKRSMYEIVF